jgi:hypothetical protein
MQANPTPQDLTLWLAAWGALLSSVLAGIKIWEFIRDSRLGLSTLYSFSSNPESGNEIILVNTSKTPILIDYWELVWAKRFWGKVKFERCIEYPDEGYSNISVDPHSRYSLNFAEARYFNTLRELGGHRVALYLKLHLAGRSKPLWIHIWDARG